ncbi:MAG: S-adenosylmethionine:tRNA ribosyltransferase-isomerase [Bacteroidetes bacterium]|nr:S-adenosylmethionine:tRNA ribosyltransferase-isomerase [Bacteroidota bacterium]
MHPKDLKIADYTYELPEHKIALHSLENRDQSKLLVYQNSEIKETIFEDIADYIPSNSLVVFNNTKVINARLVFRKATGARIEIFCLEPETFSEQSSNTCVWTCLVGNSKKWHAEILELSTQNGSILKAELLSKDQEYCKIKFSWTGEGDFWTILNQVGQIPLPPYLNREVEDSDTANYQTIYAKHFGSVAAPTAGLHFTVEVLEKLRQKNITTDEITLHVGAGTFKPVKAESIKDHQMHAEYIQITLENVTQLLLHEHRFCVGTTSLRTLESIYWIGVKLLKNIQLTEVLVSQWDAYEIESNYTYNETLEAVKKHIQQHGTLTGKTEILIAPSYQIKSVKALIIKLNSLIQLM